MAESPREPRRKARLFPFDAGTVPARGPGVDGGCNRIRRGRPTCRPVGGFREETFPGGHIGPPLRGGERFPQPTRPSCAEASATGRDRARPPQGNQSRAVYGGVKSPRPMEATQVVPSEGPKWASAPTDRKRDLCDHLGQRRTAERLRQRVRGNGWESEQGSSPKGSSTSDNPSVSLRLTAPFAQGSLGDGGCGSPRRPVGPPRNYNGFLSFRGAERRGNPFPFTMDGGSGRRGRRPLRPAGDGGTARRGRRALRVVAGRSHQLPGQRLAKRKARKEQLVKFGFCPIISECSTAYNVRKPQQSPARVPVGAASTEQNSLEPHPAARQGAPRP